MGCVYKYRKDLVRLCKNRSTGQKKSQDNTPRSYTDVIQDKQDQSSLITGKSTE